MKPFLQEEAKEFTNPETAEAFELLTDIDQWMHIPARRPEKCYYGYLTDIDPVAAERYVKFGGNLIKRKETSRENDLEGNSNQNNSLEEE